MARRQFSSNSTFSKIWRFLDPVRIVFPLFVTNLIWILALYIMGIPSLVYAFTGKVTTKIWFFAKFDVGRLPGAPWKTDTFVAFIVLSIILMIVGRIFSAKYKPDAGMLYNLYRVLFWLGAAGFWIMVMSSW